MRMKRLAGLSTLALALASLGGCGWIWGEHGYFRDRGSDYQGAQQLTPMRVPDGLQTRPLEPLLPIPAQVADDRGDGDFEVPRPQRAQLSDQERIAGQGGTVSLLAERAYDAPGGVTLIQDASGNPLLQLDSDFDRAWSSVGRALESADVLVEDLNRSLGVYYVNLAEEARTPEKKPGFFARLFGAKPDREALEARAERYQVRVVQSGASVQVSVERDLDTLAPADVARRVLGLIQDGLD